jgi:hypothetical protein
MLLCFGIIAKKVSEIPGHLPVLDFEAPAKVVIPLLEKPLLSSSSFMSHGSVGPDSRGWGPRPGPAPDHKGKSRRGRYLYVIGRETGGILGGDVNNDVCVARHTGRTADRGNNGIIIIGAACVAVCRDSRRTRAGDPRTRSGCTGDTACHHRQPCSASHGILKRVPHVPCPREFSDPEKDNQQQQKNYRRFYKRLAPFIL